MILRLPPSDSGSEPNVELASERELFYFIADCIAKWTNAHLFIDLQNIPEAEQKAEVEFYKEWFREEAWRVTH